MVARLQARQNVGRCRDGENVFKVSACNDLGLHGPAGPTLCMDQPPPCFYGFPPGGFTLQVHTAPSLHLPLFLEEI